MPQSRETRTDSVQRPTASRRGFKQNDGNNGKDIITIRRRGTTTARTGSKTSPPTLTYDVRDLYPPRYPTKLFKETFLTSSPFNYIICWCQYFWWEAIKTRRRIQLFVFALCNVSKQLIVVTTYNFSGGEKRRPRRAEQSRAEQSRAERRRQCAAPTMGSPRRSRSWSSGSPWASPSCWSSR